MRHRFWHNRWERNEIGFHQAEINPYLLQFFPSLELPEGARVFVPLCGKSLDLVWLREQGYQVVGIELNEQAVKAFFAENGLEPQVEPRGPFLSYCVENLQLFCGDFFKLTPELLGPVAGVYDRAALVALPPEMRFDYVGHLAGLLTAETVMLTIGLTYDQARLDGPPFSVAEQEVQSLFDGLFQVERLLRKSTGDLSPRFRAAGLRDVCEEVYRSVRL